jgi:hypothetical protein
LADDGYTWKGSQMARHILRLIENNQAELGIQGAIYGDQMIIPTSPYCCVEPANVRRSYAGVPFMTDNNISVAIILYGTGLEGATDVQEKLDDVSDGVAEFLNQKSLPEMLGGTLLDGKITDGFVETHEYGYTMKNDRLMRANRIIWTGFTHTKLTEGY